MGLLSKLPPQLAVKIVKALRYGLIGAVTTQIATAAAVVAIDEVRKLRGRPTVTTFPTLKPKSLKVADNNITFYTEGRTLFSDMLASIREAKEYILFETYIWKSDPIGHEFKAALIAAAKRGVDVYIVYDGFGNMVVNPAFKIFPQLAHLHVLKFPEVRPGVFTFNPRKTGRDHRKILVCDGAVGYVGGYNIGQLYAEQWRDTHVRIEGPAVWELDNGFVDFWNEMRHEYQPELPDKGARRWEFTIAAALNAPNRLLFPVRGLYIDALERATKSASLTSAYFIPDKEIQAALIAAAQRGVHVRILMPKKSNHIIADWVASAQFSELLDAGIEIWLYQNAMIHAKTAVIDGRWATVGTANIDRLSMTGNFEVNLQIVDPEAACVMERIFDNDLTNARRLTAKEWSQRSVIQRAAERILKPLSIIL